MAFRLPKPLTVRAHTKITPTGAVAITVKLSLLPPFFTFRKKQTFEKNIITKMDLSMIRQQQSLINYSIQNAIILQNLQFQVGV